MNQLRLDKREVTLNEKDSCLDMLIFTQVLVSACETAAKQTQGKELKRWLLETEAALKKECDDWERAMKKTPRM